MYFKFWNLHKETVTTADIHLGLSLDLTLVLFVRTQMWLQRERKSRMEKSLMSMLLSSGISSRFFCYWLCQMQNHLFIYICSTRFTLVIWTVWLWGRGKWLSGESLWPSQKESVLVFSEPMVHHTCLCLYIPVHVAIHWFMWKYKNMKSWANKSMTVLCAIIMFCVGAGKTTTFRMLTGDLNPTSGSAAIKGLDVVTQFQKVTNCPSDILASQELCEVFCRMLLQ